MAEHVHVMPPELQERRDRLTIMLTAFVEFLRAEDHWVIGPEHLELLDEFEDLGERLRQDIEDW